MGPISLIKLGGSLITDKRREKHARAEVIARLAGEIAELRRRSEDAWILGHGSGSFGHIEAHRHEIHRGVRSEEQLPGLAATADEAARLHRMVTGALRAAGESPFSFAPSSAMVAVAGVPETLHLEPLRRALGLGLLPVTYGDVVMDREQGCSICSTETLFVRLVAALQESGLTVSRVLWLGQTDGIYDETGATLAEVSPTDADALVDRVTGAAGIDVTGGMRHRLRATLALAARGVTSWVGNGLEPGRLGRAVAGEPVPGTWIRP
jgi:isopentenyl phosphate kinase